MHNRKKIAFVTPFYLPARLSGSGVVIQQLAENLNRKGWDCSVIASEGLNTRFWYDPIFGKRINKKCEIINGVKIYRLNCKHVVSFLSLVLVKYFKPLLPQGLFNRLNLLHCGPYLIGLSSLLNREKFTTLYSSPFPAYLNKQVVDSVQKLTPRPKLIIGPLFHATLPDYHNLELKKIFDEADLIHVATNSEKKDIQKIFKVANNKFVRLPHFLDLSNRTNINQIQKEAKVFINKFNLKNKKIILFAGAKIRQKGIFTLLAAINSLHKKDSSYRLITIGSNTPAWNKYIKKFKTNFLTDLGFVDEKQKEIIFTACDLFCLPSICESFGLTYLEAWHKKKPVIGANIPPVKELVQGANAGLLVKFNNEKNLANAIDKLILNRKLAKQLGGNGYQSLKQNYSFKKLSYKYQKLFYLLS